MKRFWNWIWRSREEEVFVPQEDIDTATTTPVLSVDNPRKIFVVDRTTGLPDGFHFED